MKDCNVSLKISALENCVRRESESLLEDDPTMPVTNSGHNIV